MLNKEATGYIQQLGLRHEQRAAGLASRNVGEILDHGDDKGFSYLVYPLYRPGSLTLFCERNRGRLTLRWCAQVTYEVLCGLAAASEHGLVHLDVKPGNIVLDGQRARVIDWGLSRKWDASRPSTWVMRGTPFFACPEQLIAPHAGLDAPPVDLYGVGATFYWMLAGEAPLQHEAGYRWDLLAYRDLLRARVRPQYVHQLVKGVPRPLSELIDRWLSFDPSQRVQPGTPPGNAVQAARDELAALLPTLPYLAVGRVTGRKRR
jgi:serine/threonine protein kinase